MKKYLLSSMVVAITLLTSCGGNKSSNPVKKDIEEIKTYLTTKCSEENPNLKFCEISDDIGLLNKDRLKFSVEDYDYYDTVIVSTKLPEKVIEVAKKEKERALQIIDNSDFQEYNSFLLKYVDESNSSDTIKIRAICKLGTTDDVKFFKDNKEYDSFIEELGSGYKKADDASMRFMRFVLEAYSLATKDEWYEVSFSKQWIDKFIVDNY